MDLANLSRRSAARREDIKLLEDKKDLRFRRDCNALVVLLLIEAVRQGGRPVIRHQALNLGTVQL